MGDRYLITAIDEECTEWEIHDLSLTELERPDGDKTWLGDLRCTQAFAKQVESLLNSQEFGGGISVEEYATRFELSAEYVRQCCREQETGTRGHVAHLAAGWRAQKAGRDWRLYLVT